MRLSRYQRMSLREKQALSLERMREAPVRCPVCGMALDVDDLLTHRRERCPGAGEPGPAARWITWREALAMGVAKGTLSGWIARGLVRVEGTRRHRRYLLRDLVLVLIASSEARTNAKGGT